MSYHIAVLLPPVFDTFFSKLSDIHNIINITQDLQQNSHITFLELEPIMANSALDDNGKEVISKVYLVLKLIP